MDLVKSNIKLKDEIERRKEFERELRG